MFNTPRRASRSEWLRRLDRTAADLNVLLVLVAMGLAALDLTFLVTQRVADRLPVTRVVYVDQVPASDRSPGHQSEP